MHSISGQKNVWSQLGSCGTSDEGSPLRQSTDPDRPRRSSATHTTEPSKDFLQIPPHRTCADTVLTWEIFEGVYPSLSLVGYFFVSGDRSISDVRLGPPDDSFTMISGLVPPNEEQIPMLVDKFLQNVHTKNPILDVEELIRQARIIARDGLGWNAWSCLTLLAAALGAIAKPFEAAVIASPDESSTSAPFIADVPATRENLQQAESYFILACRRLGTLKHSIIGVQCYFFAGVYLMYTLRPLASWQYFFQASTLYQMYMKTRYGPMTTMTDQINMSPPHDGFMGAKQKRIEESLYWSCFKSECEFRVELPLPQSEISTYHHPQLFPSPPSPPSGGIDARQSPSPFSSQDSTMKVASVQENMNPSPINTEILTLRLHAKRLCNEEESWYYYLTEIALRRIGNRIINTFFGHKPESWRDIKSLLGIALEFDTQVSAWSAHLPAAMQHWETTYTIRAPALGNVADGNGNHASRELSWATENRLLEMRSWLYQPFLYYLVHNNSFSRLSAARKNTANGQPSRPWEESTRTSAGLAEGLSVEEDAALYHFITSGIECNLKILDVRSLRHRHHGLWYDMRSLMCASLILLAVVKSGHEAWISGGVEGLWGLNSGEMSQGQPIGGKIGHVLAEFNFWSTESPDLVRHAEVLEDMTRRVQAVRHARHVQ